MNTEVQVIIEMVPKELFCNIIFTAIKKMDKSPIQGVTIELHTIISPTQLIDRIMTDSIGRAVIYDMPVAETYYWKATHPSYNDIAGQVTTI